MHDFCKFSFIALSGLLFSCSGSNSSPSTTEDAEKVLALDEISGKEALRKKYANYQDDVVLDDKGRVKGNSKRSSFENKQLTSIGGDFRDQNFAASRYSKKNWQGSKNFESGKFETSQNRWGDQEWFLKKQAQEASSNSRNQGQAFNASDFRTTTANEQNSTRLSYGSDVRTDVRRRVYKEPLVIDDEAYEKMSLEESKNILGR